MQHQDFGKGNHSHTHTHTHTIFVGSPLYIDAYVWVAHHRDGCGRFMLQSGENKFAGNQRSGAAAHHFQQHAVLRQSKIVRDGSFLQKKHRPISSSYEALPRSLRQQHHARRCVLWPKALTTHAYEHAFLTAASPPT